MKKEDLKDYMDSKVDYYNRPEFLRSDPIQVPHCFTAKEDIEISGFLTATIAWGNRKSIIRNAGRLMEMMDMAPYSFITGHESSDLAALQPFVHRTFNSTDLIFFIQGLKHLYRNEGGLETFFSRHATPYSMQPAITSLKNEWLRLPHPARSAKHLPDPSRGSAAKRMNMFLRWMVRDASTQVDFGLWKSLKPSQLSCPLDVHTGNVARHLGLLSRKQNDAKAVAELDAVLREWDPYDPVKYDFALFGMGAFENWS